MPHLWHCSDPRTAAPLAPTALAELNQAMLNTKWREPLKQCIKRRCLFKLYDLPTMADAELKISGRHHSSGLSRPCCARHHNALWQ